MRRTTSAQPTVGRFAEIPRDQYTPEQQEAYCILIEAEGLEPGAALPSAPLKTTVALGNLSESKLSLFPSNWSQGLLYIHNRVSTTSVFILKHSRKIRRLLALIFSRTSGIHRSRRDEDEQWSGQPRPVLDRILTAQSTIALQLTLAKIVSRIPIWYRKASLDR